MIKTIVRQHHWAPEAMGALYFDDLDYEGLLFWFDEVMEAIAEMKKRASDKN